MILITKNYYPCIVKCVYWFAEMQIIYAETNEGCITD